MVWGIRLALGFEGLFSSSLSYSYCMCMSSFLLGYSVRLIIMFKSIPWTIGEKVAHPYRNS